MLLYYYYYDYYSLLAYFLINVADSLTSWFSMFSMVMLIAEGPLIWKWNCWKYQIEKNLGGRNFGEVVSLNLLV